MPTTPVSVSAGIQSSTNTTVYTVPVGKTAIVKAVSAQAVTSGSSNLTVSKSVSGQNFPVVVDQATNYQPPTGATERKNENALTAPLTMAAGEQLKVYTSASNAYALPNVSTAGLTAADGSSYFIYANLFANGIYMAVGQCTSGVYVATSTDAITWTQRTSALPFGTRWNTLSCNGSVWVATNVNSTQGTVYYSSDNGVTWGAAVVVAGAFNCNSIPNNGSTFLISFNNGKIYSSTNGSTWTESTTYYSTVGSTNTTIYNIGWSGSHWIIDNLYGSLASTDLTTWYGYVTPNSGRSFSNIFTTEYSSAYSKYYTSRNLDSVPNIWSSPNGLLWENIYSGAFTPYKVNIAGSNTVLIAVGSSGTTAVLKSTNGSTWASATVAGGYGGPMWGLENGYFLTMLNYGTNDACSLSADPTAGTGTTGPSNVSGFYCRNAAADPSSGKWIGVGDDGTNIYFMGGTSGTNIGTTANPSLTVGANGTPRSVTWSAVDGYFYMITTTGRVLRGTAFNSAWTSQATSIGGGSDGQQCIKAVGTTLYVVSANQSNTVWTSSTLTNGSSWTQNNYTTINANGYRNTGLVSGGGYYNSEALATNGTDLVWTNTNGQSYALTPSISTNGMRMPIPQAIGMPQTVNSNTFLYGGYFGASYGDVYGYFTSTNVITTYGTFVSTYSTGANWSTPGTMPNKINYIGGSYYVTSSILNGYIWTGTTTTNIANNYAGIGSSFAGVTVVNPSNGWMIDGTNLVSSRNGTNLTNVCKTTTPSQFLYGATVNASIVEIS